MPRRLGKKRNFIVYDVNEPVDYSKIEKYNYREDETKYLERDYVFNVGDLADVIVHELIDPATNKYLVVRCKVHFVEIDPATGIVYYYFVALGDYEHMNTLWDNKFPEKYFKILESTSTYYKRVTTDE